MICPYWPKNGVVPDQKVRIRIDGFSQDYDVSGNQVERARDFVVSFNGDTDTYTRPHVERWSSFGIASFNRGKQGLEIQAENIRGANLCAKRLGFSLPHQFIYRVSGTKQEVYVLASPQKVQEVHRSLVDMKGFPEGVAGVERQFNGTVTLLVNSLVNGQRFVQELGLAESA